MTERAPVIGELWTDHPKLPHGTSAQITAWLLAAWNPRLVAITATDPSHAVIEPGMVGYARYLDEGSLGREEVMAVGEFMRSFRRVPDGPEEPWDIPPEVPR